jgi:uncharacterized protein YfiM (DUF2279 family)
MLLKSAVILSMLGAFIAESCAFPPDSSSINKKRLNTVLIASGTAYAASLIALNEAWYKQQQTSFHFFNDCSAWNQVDKAGHACSAYQLSNVGNQLFLWTGMPKDQSAIWGTVMGQVFMTTIEVFDGFSAEYGFSWCDITSNMLGGGLFLGQELIWQQQFVKMKFSYHFTDYAALRPEVLGETAMERILKDYNGHTYWLSIDIYALAKQKGSIPHWINPALGYGAGSMVYGREYQNNANGFQSYRQFYLGIDFDLSHIKTKSSFVNTLIFIADMVKLPAPALEFNTNNGFNFHWLYF